MKYLSIVVTTMVLAILGCSDNATEPENNGADTQTFQSVNVKTEGKQYFTFSTNSGTLTKPDVYDIAFGVVPLTVETAPCQFFTMPNDPVIFSGPGVSMARVDAASLDDVTDIPQAAAFTADDPQGDPFIGKNWFDAQYQVKPDVYVVKTCAGKFGVLAIKRYEMDFAKHQIKNMVWEFKYNRDGSTDFSTTLIDSFATGNSYEEIKYFAFASGAVTANETYDIKVDGSSIWMGQEVTVKKLENTSIGDVTTITDSGFEADVLPSYVTRGWYNYGEGHTLTPNDYVYVVKTAEGKYPAFEITNYYDDQGNSGTFTIEWKYLNGH
ncbi:MAG TPA: hypothetical protein EYP36_12675 [Calditrichaeota bacterium]|nr:hypothetical protein [Calditrichota bacterium]